MRTICGLLLAVVVAGCVSTEGEKTDGSTRLKFVPGSAPSSPLEAGEGAVWTRLAPRVSQDDNLTLQAHAGIGDKFPVAKPDGPTLFEVLFKDGNDDRVILEVLTTQGPQIVELQRDKPVETVVAGTKYRFLYPSVEVASTENKTTTNKATLFVTTPRQ